MAHFTSRPQPVIMDHKPEKRDDVWEHDRSTCPPTWNTTGTRPYEEEHSVQNVWSRKGGRSAHRQRDFWWNFKVSEVFWGLWQIYCLCCATFTFHGCLTFKKWVCFLTLLTSSSAGLQEGMEELCHKKDCIFYLTHTQKNEQARASKVRSCCLLWGKCKRQIGSSSSAALLIEFLRGPGSWLYLHTNDGEHSITQTNTCCPQAIHCYISDLKWGVWGMKSSGFSWRGTASDLGSIH